MPPPSRIDIKVVPGASRTQVVGFLGPALKVRVAAPPEGGKANEEVLTLLADLVGVPRKEVELVAGRSNPRKTLAFSTLTEEALFDRLAAGGVVRGGRK